MGLGLKEASLSWCSAVQYARSCYEGLGPGPWVSLLGVKTGMELSAQRWDITLNLAPHFCVSFDSLTAIPAVGVNEERR